MSGCCWPLWKYFHNGQIQTVEVAAEISTKWPFTPAHRSSGGGRFPAAPADCSALGGVLSWAAGDGTNQTIVVPIVADAIPEPAKSFKVTLSSPTGATLGARTTITVNIRAN